MSIMYIPIIFGVLSITFLIFATSGSRQSLALDILFLMVFELVFVSASAFLLQEIPSDLMTGVYIISLGVFVVTLVMVFLQFITGIFNFWGNGFKEGART